MLISHFHQCLCLTYAVCYEDIKPGSIFFSFLETAFDIISRSKFNTEMDL